jgi:hypothetical protein
MEKILQRRNRNAYLVIVLWFAALFAVAALATSCAQNPLTSTKTCVSYGKVKPLANPSFLSDRR